MVNWFTWPWSLLNTKFTLILYPHILKISSRSSNYGIRYSLADNQRSNSGITHPHCIAFMREKIDSPCVDERRVRKSVVSLLFFLPHLLFISMPTFPLCVSWFCCSSIFIFRPSDCILSLPFPANSIAPVLLVFCFSFFGFRRLLWIVRDF